jgi:uncharacterized protein YciI
MPYIVETWDKEGHAAVRREHRPAHLEFLAEKHALLLACGAKLDDDGSDAGGGIYVLDVATRGEAEAFIAADPFHRAGLFRQVTITRWRKAYVDGRCLL